MIIIIIIIIILLLLLLGNLYSTIVLIETSRVLYSVMMEKTHWINMFLNVVWKMIKTTIVKQLLVGYSIQVVPPQKKHVHQLLSLFEVQLIDHQYADRICTPSHIAWKWFALGNEASEDHDGAKKWCGHIEMHGIQVCQHRWNWLQFIKLTRWDAS